MSSKLNSLVEATEDPRVLIYVWEQLGKGVPNNACFRDTIMRIRQSALERLLGHYGPKRQMQQLQQMQKNQIARLDRKRRELIEDQATEIMLQVQEKQLALVLFQQSSIGVFMKKLMEAPPK